MSQRNLFSNSALKKNLNLMSSFNAKDKSQSTSDYLFSLNLTVKMIGSVLKG